MSHEAAASWNGEIDRRLICVRPRSGSKHCKRNKCIHKCMDLALLFSQALNISFNYFLFYFSTVSGLDHFIHSKEALKILAYRIFFQGLQ